MDRTKKKGVEKQADCRPAIIPVTVEVKKDREGNFYLYFVDNQGHSGRDITTLSRPGDIILWTISTRVPGITISIHKVYEKNEPGHQDLFKPDPYRNDNGSWSGKVNTCLAPGIIESYGVKYYVDGQLHDDDPKIKVHSE